MGFFSKSKEIIIDNIDNENEKWKNKYLNLLDTQELVENTYKSNQELLCKTIVRLSIVASGTDPQLEPYLQRIRDHIKKGIVYPQLKTEVDDFTNAVNRLTGETKGHQKVNKDIDLLFAFLLQHYTSVEQQQALNLLHKTFKPNDDPEVLFSEICQILEEEPEAQLTANHLNVETLTVQPVIDQDFVRAQLIQLLDQIEMPEDLAYSAETLKLQLEHKEAPEPLEKILGKVISLLIETNVKSQSKQQEFDKFLAHITEQLTELGLTITDTGIALMDASLNRSSLDQSVSDHINDLQHRSSNATQLEPLKQVISSHIAKITLEIQEHKQKEAIQREKYQHQLDELSQKIKAMELETGELQSKLLTANTNAQRDALTDLPNRLAYDERLKMETGRWQRYHTPLCLVVWDIDYFKRVNDQFGHQIGDKVLIHIASLFSGNIRRADFIARLGGEEFIMLLPHTNKHSALKVADKLRILIEQSSMEVHDKALPITVSCGITQFLKGDTHESAFERADQALYRAKEQGRNGCCLG